MRSFAYATAARTEDAVAAARAGATVLAGGTELLNWMRLGIAEPDRVIDISRLQGLEPIRLEAGQLHIGARATLNQVGEHPEVARLAAVLSEACLKAASAQIRNRATLGGNILQKTRCAYFRAEAPLPWGCNKRVPGTGCSALEGVSERLAVLDWTDACVATQPSDPAVALAALDTTVEVTGPEGPRSIPMAAFHVTQAEAARERLGDPARVENRLRPGEVITGYRIPVREGRRSHYLKIRERESYEYALVSAAAVLDLDGERIGEARIALGSVAQKPWRLTAAETALRGQPLDRALIRQAVSAALADARPLKDNAYKVRLAANTAVRALETAGGLA